MLILGALPLPCEGTWVPIGNGVWLCDSAPALRGRVRLDVEDTGGQILSHVLSEEQIRLSGKRVRAVILEAIDGVERIHLGISRVRL
jgi:hypothetical protein